MKKSLIERQKYTSEDEKNIFILLKLVGFGFLLALIIMFGTRYIRSKEYPNISLKVELNDNVQDFSSERGAVFITFSSGKKYAIDNNSNLEVGGPNLIGIVGFGDLVVKKSNSDTLAITHGGQKYLYIIKGLK